MRDETVARNYADALFELARKHDAIDGYGDAIRTVATLIDENPQFRLFLETPRIDPDQKKKVVREALGDRLPKTVVNFVLLTIDKRRQRILRAIADGYDALLDEHMNRAHVEVSVARPLDEDATQKIGERLSKLLGKTAIPHVRVKPELLGGIVVRSGDTIYDGSLRRRLERMRRQLLNADSQAAAGASD